VDVQWSHRLSDAWKASLGFQRSQRHMTFEEHPVIDWNAFVGCNIATSRRDHGAVCHPPEQPRPALTSGTANERVGDFFSAGAP
jgi:hypothetical protein